MEDLRAAASIHASISSQIFGASLVLMGVFVGYLDIKDIEYSSLPGILTFLGIFLLLTSTIAAGIGLKKLRDNGSNRNWLLDDLHIYFRIQTLLNYISIGLFLSVVFITNGETSNEKFQKKLIQIESRQLTLDSLNYIENKKQLKILNNRIDSLNFYISQVSCCKKRKPCP